MKHFLLLAILAIAIASCTSPPPAPQPTYTPLPTYTPYPTFTPLARATFPPAGQPTSIPAAKTTSVPQPPVSTGPCISWKDAAARIGETTCVRGTVYSASKSGSTFFINFDNTRTSFYGVSFDHTWDNLKGKCVELYGRVSPYNGRPQIIINTKDQLKDCQ